jgi:hypothetical protein
MHQINNQNQSSIINGQLKHWIIKIFRQKVKANYKILIEILY